jgi:hypothetical protein
MTAAGGERFDCAEEYLASAWGARHFRRTASAILNMNCNGYLGRACCSRIFLIDLVRNRKKFSHGSADFAILRCGFLFE